MTLRKIVGAAGLAAILAASFTSTPFAAEEKAKRFPESQYRHDNMEHASYAIDNIVQLLKGTAAHDGHMAKLAEIIALSAAMSKDTFAKDTRGFEGRTGAKDAIWENWEDFAARSDAYAADAAAFAATAKDGDQEATVAAFKKTASHCKSCHDKYQD